MSTTTAHLHDSDTTERLTARDLGMTRAEYLAAIRESRDVGTAEGHIRIDTPTGSRRVYAA